MDEPTKKIPWEVVSLAKQIFAVLLLDSNENIAKIAKSAIEAAQIFFDELAKKEGAT